MKRNNIIPSMMLSISLLGFLFFYLFPFIISLIYGLTDNPINMKFVGLKNFSDLLQNKYFMLGLKNTAIFMAISIPLNILLSLVIALVINKSTKYRNHFSLVFLIPLVIPSATIAFFWENLFSLNGIVNKYLSVFGIEKIDWFQSKYGMLVMIFIFLWKNIGYNMALFISGLNNIPEEYYECADIEGANWFHKFTKITLLYLMPTIFLVLIMTFVNSFKVFKEIYIITGEYPHESLYVLQHYMNNMFLSLNYSKLVSAVYILTIVIVFFVAVVFKTEDRFAKDLRS
ncbi:sugar ABC transporter permease [Tissierella sp. MB52-C2]|uniref:carbohydrate ABC transporter permease n=1 Tax=Tissierella sp. MB52-C2 TaxID=3070999 RepID=UPI00280B5305|nr:sugar ABC transporter permease [Tissierella sp. MB52-C2]WMM26353.1 sugar ABC transporter permease [Tissierella sp. MB52-C2]